MADSLTLKKNPISLLYEESAKHGCALNISFIESDALTHLPTFECIVQFLGQKVSGKGRSKQEAKQAAAKFALEAFSDLFGIASPTKSLSPSPEESEMKFTNSVGELMEYCTTKSYPAAKYELLDEAGPPHSRIFRLKCSVLQLSAIGEGKTKKIAKQESAKMVLRMLKEDQTPENNKILESELKRTRVKKIASLDILSILRQALISNEAGSSENNLKKDRSNPFFGVKYKSRTLLKILKDNSLVTKESSFYLLEEIAKELNAPLLLEGVVDANMFTHQERLITIKRTGNIDNSCFQSHKFKTNDCKIFVVSLKLDIELVALGSDVTEATLNLLTYLLILSI